MERQALGLVRCGLEVFCYSRPHPAPLRPLKRLYNLGGRVGEWAGADPMVIGKTLGLPLPLMLRSGERRGRRSARNLGQPRRFLLTLAGRAQTPSMDAVAGRLGHVARHQHQSRLRHQPHLILRRTTPRGHLPQRQSQDSQRQTTGNDPWANGAGDREERRNAVHAAMIRRLGLVPRCQAWWPDVVALVSMFVGYGPQFC